MNNHEQCTLHAHVLTLFDKNSRDIDELHHWKREVENDIKQVKETSIRQHEQSIRQSENISDIKMSISEIKLDNKDTKKEFFKYFDEMKQKQIERDKTIKKIVIAAIGPLLLGLGFLIKIAFFTQTL